MKLQSILRKIVPEEFQPPTDLGRRLLTATGYYRLRTWVSARGMPVPDAHLYRPLFSPWEGDADFERFYRPAGEHTLVSRSRCFVLWKTLLQARHLPGAFMECGVFRGGTALLEAETLASFGTERELHLFDSFQGMPETSEQLDPLRQGTFRRTSADVVRQRLSPYAFVRLHVGFIPKTFEGLDFRLCWAHVDVDAHQSVRDCVDYIYPRLVPGGMMIFDDYAFPSCSGSRRAVDEAFSNKPEVPLCLPTGQCLVIKLPEPTSQRG